MPTLPARTEGAPRFVIISAGTEEQIRATGFASAVPFDPTFRTGPMYGANGTPIAVLVDAGGKMASDVAVGAEGVLALLAQKERVGSPSLRLFCSLWNPEKRKLVCSHRLIHRRFIATCCTG